MEDGKGCKIIELRTIELRSEKELPNPYEVPKLESKEENGGQCTQEENIDGWVEVQKLVPQLTPTKYIQKIPYPQKLQKSKHDLKFQEFLNIFMKMSINIPFAKTLEQMAIFAKFMK